VSMGRRDLARQYHCNPCIEVLVNPDSPGEPVFQDGYAALSLCSSDQIHPLH